MTFFKIMNFLLKYNMFTEYAQIRRIQINELYSEHTHVITTQFKTLLALSQRSLYASSYSLFSFFFPRVATTIAYNMINEIWFEIYRNGIIHSGYLPFLFHTVFVRTKFVKGHSEITKKSFTV